MKKEKTKKNKFGRRDFLIRLGAGTALTIAGYFTFDTFDTAISDSRENASDKPKLSGGIKKYYENSQMILSGENGRCMVNKTGEKIIEMLDGKNSLSSISANISGFYSIEHTDALEVSIASFLCQLGSQGFLSAPFYVIMYENYEL